MSTKGPSNKYGATKGAKIGPHGTKRIAFQWAKDFNKRSLDQHFGDHAKQFGIGNKNEYIRKAIRYANLVDRDNVKSFVDKKLTTYKYNVKTNTLAIIDKKGYVITFFKPKEGYEYYLKEFKSKGKRR